MAKAWLGLGANVGDPPAQLEDAISRLDALGGTKVLARSAIIETAPWGNIDQDPFHNMALAIETDSSPEELLQACLEIERQMGRIRITHWGPRLIDIDVIAYERVVMESETLTLPHPYAHERDFVLEPLREIAPEIADWIVGRQA